MVLQSENLSHMICPSERPKNEVKIGNSGDCSFRKSRIWVCTVWLSVSILTTYTIYDLYDKSHARTYLD